MDSNNNMHLAAETVTQTKYNGSKDEVLTDKPALSLKMV